MASPAVSPPTLSDRRVAAARLERARGIVAQRGRGLEDLDPRLHHLIPDNTPRVEAAIAAEHRDLGQAFRALEAKRSANEEYFVPRIRAGEKAERAAWDAWTSRCAELGQLQAEANAAQDGVSAALESTWAALVLTEPVALSAVRGMIGARAADHNRALVTRRDRDAAARETEAVAKAAAELRASCDAVSLQLEPSADAIAKLARLVDSKLPTAPKEYADWDRGEGEL
jgi:hypothetical protein